MPRLIKPKPHSGQFKKGSSGNPGGRPKGIFEMAKEAQKYGPEAVLYVYDVMTSPHESTRDRLKAAQELLDRGYGKPKQTSEVSGVEGGPVELVVRVITKQASGN